MCLQLFRAFAMQKKQIGKTNKPITAFAVLNKVKYSPRILNVTI